MLAAVTLFDLSRDRMWDDFSFYYRIYDFLKLKFPVFINPSSHSEQWNSQGRGFASPVKFVKLICSRLKSVTFRVFTLWFGLAIISLFQHIHWLFHTNWTVWNLNLLLLLKLFHFNISYIFTVYLIYENGNYSGNLTSFIHKEKPNKMQQCIKILLFHIYTKLNMFRATHRPSSGA
jgi:hypothetical protein